MELKARKEKERQLIRMRGPEGDRARQMGRVGVNQARHRGPAPVMNRIRHDSPQVFYFYSRHRNLLIIFRCFRMPQNLQRFILTNK